MDAKTRRQVCELVAGIIATDNELHPSELEFLLRTFETHGIGKGNEDEAICPAVSRIEAVKAIADLPVDIRQETVKLLVASAVVDGKVVLAEREYLLAVAKAADVAAEDVEQMISDGLAATADD